MKVVLPTLTRDVIRYREGSDPSETTRLLPGLAHFGDCILERGVVPAHPLRQRRLVQVALEVELDANHAPVLNWRLRNAFPRALSWSPLDAQDSTALIETLTLVVEGVDLQSS